MKRFKKITYEERLKIESLYNIGIKPTIIAEQLNHHNSTIYREIKRGLYKKLNGDTYIYYTAYSADIAQRITEHNKPRGAELKISNDYDYVKFIEHMILKKKYSPEAILYYIKNNNLNFKTNVCKTTLYSYIEKGIFLNVSNKNLLRKKNKKKKYNKVHKAVKPPIGTSIDERPHYINMCNQFGHWELDSVIGKREKGETLLVLTERKTNYEIIYKSEGKTAQETVKLIDYLENKYGDKFKTLFKTITVDNGTEFSDCKGMEYNKHGEKRIQLYYCHPYSSWERGKNEVQNAFIRRFIPKGTKIECYSTKHIQKIQNYINNYPRGIFNGKTSLQMYKNELKELGINNKH